MNCIQCEERESHGFAQLVRDRVYSSSAVRGDLPPQHVTRCALISVLVSLPKNSGYPAGCPQRLNHSSDTNNAVHILESNEAAAGIGEIFAGPSMKLLFGDPTVDTRVPDIAVQPNVGMSYTAPARFTQVLASGT